MEKSINKELVAEMVHLHVVIVGTTTDEIEREKAIRRLEEIIIVTRFSKLEEQKLLRVFGEDLYPYYDKYFFEPTVAVEKKFLQQTIENKKVDLRNIQKRTLLYFKFPALVKEEILAAGISKDDTVAFIGSGPFPLTAILYNRYSGAKVHCIEKEESSCVESRKLLKKLGLENEITVIHTQGEKIRNQNYSLISMASQAYPKDAILEHLLNVLAPKTKVLFRVQCGAAVIFYNGETNISSSILNKFALIKRMPRADYTMMSLLYEVK
jgi:protein-L-isoaspartate O-methyltransferase